MQTSFDTSFIPRQPLLRVDGVERRPAPVNLPLVLSFVVFFVALITAGGIFFYHRQVTLRIEDKVAKLADLESKLNSDDISLYKNIDSRIGTAKTLLSKHRAFTAVLSFLEQETVKDIGLTTLNFKADGNDQVSIHVRGVGPSFQSVYLQSETWKGASSVIKTDMNSYVLSDSTGLVDFDATILLNADFMKYADTLAKSDSSTTALDNQTAEQISDDAQSPEVNSSLTP